MTLPSPDDDYAAPADLALTVEVWNAVFASIGARLRAREALEATFEDLIEAGIGQVLLTIQTEIEPVLADIEDTADTVEGRVAAAEAALAGILAGQLPASQVTLAAIAGFAPTQIQNAISVIVNRAITAGTGLTGGGNLTADRSFAVDLATAAQIRAGTADKVVGAGAIYSALAPVALTYGSTVTPDFAAGRNFTLALTGNATLANPTNQAAGQSGLIRISQDATGGRTLSYGTHWKFNGGAPLLTGTANSVDAISYYIFSPNEIICTLLRDFKS